MVLAEFFVFFISILIIKYFWQQRRFLLLASKIPKSDFDFSLKGILRLIFADSKELFEMSYASFKNSTGTVKTWMGPELMIIVCHPEDVKIIFNSKETIEKPKFMRFFGAPESVLFGDYGPWHSHKKILNPHFNVNGIKGFIPIFNEKVKILMESVKEMEGKDEFNIFYYLTSLALETILQVMEYEVDIQKSEKNDRESYIKHLREFFKAVSLRIFKPWLHPEFIYTNTHIYARECKAMSNSAMKFTREIMNNHENNFCKDIINNNEDFNKIKHKSFINDLYKNNLADKDIFDEIKTLLVAAQDTTANSSSSVILLLAMYKEIQQKVLDELHLVFGKSIEPSYITQKQINELHYLDMVINEAMRLMPVVPIVFRKVCNEIKLHDGLILPKGATVIVPIFKMHHNKYIWGDDAEEFRPERFEKENFQKIHPYAFVPFTKGPRICLGYRYGMTLMKIQLANFLMRYEVDTSLKFEDLQFELNTTLSVCQGYMIKIKERKF